MEFAEQLRQLTRQLAISEERIATFARAGNWLWEADLAGRLVYISAGTPEAGLDMSPYLGRTWAETVFQHPDNRAGVGELQTRMARRESFREVVCQIRSGSGATRWCAISGDPMRDQANDFCGYRGVGRDVTETVRAQAQLAVRSLVFEAVWKAIPDAVRVIDAEKNVTTANDQLYAMFDLDKQEDAASPNPIQHALRELAGRGEYGPGDPETLARNRQAEVERQLATEGSVYYERRLRNGRWIEARFQAIEGGGWVELYRDVTEKKLREQELERQSALLETIFANMSEGISVFDENLLLVAANVRSFELTGVDPAICPPGAALRDILVSQARAGEFGDCDPEALADRRIRELEQLKPLVWERTRRNRQTIELHISPIAGGGFVMIYVDITARKRLEQELRDLNVTLEQRVEERTAALAVSERFNRATLDALDAHVAVLDGDGRIITTNTAWQRSVTNDAISPRDGVPPLVEWPDFGAATNYLDVCDRATGARRDEARAIAAGIRAVIAGRQHRFEMEYTHHLPTRQRWMLCRVSRFREGDLLRLVVSHEDVTTVRQTLEELRLSEARFRSAFDAAGHGMAWVGLDDRFLRINAAYCRILGYSEGELLGRIAQEITYPEDVATDIANRERLIAGEMPVSQREKRYIRKDGTIVWTLFNAGLVRDTAGAPLHYIVHIQDITERKAAEREILAVRGYLLDALESIGHGVMLTDIEGRIVLFNHAYADRYGHLADRIRIGTRFEEIFRAAVESDQIVVPAELDKEAFIAARIAQHQRAGGETTIRQLNDGRVLHVTERRARNGGVIAVTSDVTEQLKTEQNLRQAQKMEAVGQLTAGIAHDFNNLLSAVVSNLDLAVEQLTADPMAASQHTNKAIDAALAGAELVRRLLAFARQQPLQPKPTDIEQIIAGMALLLRPTLGERIAIETTVTADLWLAMVDATQVESVLLNLALNARDAMSDGGMLRLDVANISVSGDLFDADNDLKAGDYVVVTVTDTGAGMAPEVIVRAFEPFFTTKEVGAGSGLGLSMVLGTMQQLGGTARITSALGQGTTVRLFLPRAAPVAETDPVDRAAPAQPGGTARILLVEDNELIRNGVEMMLRSLAYAVAVAPNADAALALWDRGERFDLVFSDIIMPGRYDGIGLARELRMRDSHVKILLTSGYANPIAVQGDIDTLGLEVLQKPYRKAILAARLRAVLDQNKH